MEAAWVSVNSEQLTSPMLSKHKDKSWPCILCINMDMCLHADADLKRSVAAWVCIGNVPVKHECEACKLCCVLRKDRLVWGSSKPY